MALLVDSAAVGERTGGVPMNGKEHRGTDVYTKQRDAVSFSLHLHTYVCIYKDWPSSKQLQTCRRTMMGQLHALCQEGFPIQNSLCC